MKDHVCCCGRKETGPEPRRGFLAKLGALGAGAFAFCIPAGIGLNAYLNPLRQKGATELWVKVAQLDGLTDVPSRITVLDDKVDAWSRENNVPIGTIFLRKIEGDAPAEVPAEEETPAESDASEAAEAAPNVTVEALQAMCPHAGALVTLQTFTTDDGTSQVQYYCPSHKATFELDGIQKPESEASPRDLDTLEAEVREGGEVWVRFQTFQTGGGSKVVAG